MKARIKSGIQYIIILVIMGILLWFSISNLKTENGISRWEFVVLTWNSVNKELLLLSGVAAVISHLLRAERWKLSFQPMKIKINLWSSFLSVMVGYFINLIIPRGGELSRCVNLNKLEGIPIDKSFGTVLAERAVDLIFLIVFVVVGFILEFDKLNSFLSELEYENPANWGKIVFYGLILIVALIIGLALLRRVLRSRSIGMMRKFVKVKNIFLGIKQGLLVVFHLKSKFLFLFYTLLIWTFYLIMSVSVLKAFPETSHLGFIASLAIFAIGGIAMALPLPGGTGSYHVLVPAGLVALYHIALDKATAFTIIFHGWQTLIIIVIGAASLLISYFTYHTKKKKKLSNS